MISWKKIRILIACFLCIFHVLTVKSFAGNIITIRGSCRVKTVIRELMYFAACLVRSRNRLRLRFSRHRPAYQSFADVYGKLQATVWPVVATRWEIFAESSAPFWGVFCQIFKEQDMWPPRCGAGGVVNSTGNVKKIGNDEWTPVLIITLLIHV